MRGWGVPPVARLRAGLLATMLFAAGCAAPPTTRTPAGDRPTPSPGIQPVTPSPAPSRVLRAAPETLPPADVVPPLPQAVLPGTTNPAPPPTVRPMDPDALARRLEAMQPGWRHRPDCAHTNCVALTFDDGPGEYTGKLLDLLRARGVRATFFVLGQMVAADHGWRTLRRIASQGHEIGNHSWSHAQLTSLSEHGIRRELSDTERLVRTLTGIRMTMMRPPFGATGHRVAAEARRAGLAQILWSLDTLDWQDRNSALVTKRAARADPGDIVLMHDIHRTTVTAVPKLLDRLEKKGYTFVTVSELYGKALEPGREYTRR